MRTMCLKSKLKSAKNVQKLEKHYFLMYDGFHSIQGFLNTLGSMCGTYWLTYSTRALSQIRRHLWQQLLSIVCKDSISIIECMWWKRGLGFVCCSFLYFIGFPYSKEIL